MKKNLEEQYFIENKISEGNFGIVYKVKNKKTKKIFAMKKLYITKKNKNYDKEIENLSKIKSDRVIKLIDFEIKKDVKVILILEYCEDNLFNYLQNISYPLSKSAIKSIIYNILKGINDIHNHNIIHRDIKPSNILINSKGNIKIGDFGLSIDNNDRDENGKFLNEGFTTWYKAPELIFGYKKYSFEIDIWSLGCIFAELLNGSPIFPAVNDYILIGKISKILGSPNNYWKSFENMPDYNKIQFETFKSCPFEEVFLDIKDDENEFLSLILKYEERTEASKLLKCNYFKSIPLPLDYIIKEENLEIEELAKYEDIFNLNL